MGLGPAALDKDPCKASGPQRRNTLGPEGSSSGGALREVGTGDLDLPVAVRWPVSITGGAGRPLLEFMGACRARWVTAAQDRPECPCLPSCLVAVSAPHHVPETHTEVEGLNIVKTVEAGGAGHSGTWAAPHSTRKRPGPSQTTWKSEGNDPGRTRSWARRLVFVRMS